MDLVDGALTKPRSLRLKGTPKRLLDAIVYPVDGAGPGRLEVPPETLQGPC